MKKLIPVLFLLVSFSLFANPNKNFNSPSVTTENYLDHSRANSKNILMYFQNETCGICNLMNKTVFVDSTVLNFIHSNFICVQVNTDITNGDKLKDRFMINSFPTFIIVNQQNEEYHRLVGKFDELEFINHVRNALKEENTLSFKKSLFEEGNRKPEFLLDFCYSLHISNQLDSTYINEYLKTQSDADLFKRKNLQLLYDFAYYKHEAMISPKSKVFSFLINNWNQLAVIKDEDQAKVRIVALLLKFSRESIETGNFKDFESYTNKLKEFEREEPYFFEIKPNMFLTIIKPFNISSILKIEFHNKNGTIKDYGNALNEHLQLIWNNSSELNNFAYYQQKILTEKNKLELLIPFVNRSIEIEETPNNYETLATIYEKINKKNLAVKNIKLAIDLAYENQWAEEKIDILRNRLDEIQSDSKSNID